MENSGMIWTIHELKAEFFPDSTECYVGLRAPRASGGYSFMGIFIPITELANYHLGQEFTVALTKASGNEAEA